MSTQAVVLGTLVVTVVVVLVCGALQAVLGRRSAATIALHLSRPLEPGGAADLRGRGFEVLETPAPPRWRLTAARGPQDRELPDQLFDDGADEQTYWRDHLVAQRHGYLERTRTTAGRWRDLFTGLFAFVAAALSLGGSRTLPSDLGALAGPVLAAAVVTLVLGLHAVAYAGWAATGLPRSGARTTSWWVYRQDEYEHAYRSQIRLRIGLVCGLLSVVVAIGLVAVYLAAQLGIVA